TESALMQDIETSIATMERLVALGVAFSIDDFGTGYSSLSYLKRFPVDTLKIDASFIRGVPDNSHDAAIAGTIIALAHNLGVRAVAEGVSTAEQVKFLRLCRCDAVQGYYFSPPRPASEFTDLLSKKTS
ncbi:MAG: EAL domain-containing protein, partial [Gammaproteobacteria bacterium]|nr:EAL domain-containing protein [Gammaproteobacteria bacterium]